MAFLVVAAVAMGTGVARKWFQTFSRLTLLVMFAAGGMTIGMIHGISKGDPPWLGLAERVAIGAYLVWIVALAVALIMAPAPRPYLLFRLHRRPPPAAGGRRTGAGA